MNVSVRTLAAQGVLAKPFNIAGHLSGSTRMRRRQIRMTSSQPTIASSLVRFGILESQLGSREAARRDLLLAQRMLERQIQQSPKNRPVRDVYGRAAAAMAALN